MTNEEKVKHFFELYGKLTLSFLQRKLGVTENEAKRLIKNIFSNQNNSSNSSQR